ncbi:MAG TPA: hypothetical protein VGL81_11615 [Polyangiaceae bacterium]
MRPPHILLFLTLAACAKGPDPSTTGGDTAGVLVTGLSGYVGSAVVDTQGQVYVTAAESLDVVRFPPAQPLASNWGAPPSQPAIELAIAGGTLWWAANDGSNSSLWSSTEASFVSPPPAAIAFPGIIGSDVIGLVADGTAVYAAVSTPKPLPPGTFPPVTGPSPDSWQWPGSPAVDTPFDGSIYRIVPGAPATVQALAPTGGITFFPGFMQHVLAESTTEVYWVDSAPVGSQIGRVMVASKADWATDLGHSLGGIAPVDGLATGFVGLAASDTYTAWAVAPEPNPGSTGCWVWASEKDGAPREIFDSDLAPTSFSCNGLAIDDTYAYFAMVEVYVPPAGVDGDVLLGTGIARVPLAGGPLETAPLTADRWYGPRRVLVDDTYVYAIDPNYVLRFPKTAFAP